MNAQPTWDLRSVPVQALTQELYRRGVDPLSCLPDLRLPGLVIRPSHYLVEWDGRAVRIRPREMDILLAIYRAHPGGITGRRLAQEVCGSDRRGALLSVRTHVCHLRKALPGLLCAPDRHEPTFYTLAGVERVAWRTGAAG